jgi:hypothetical protein
MPQVRARPLGANLGALIDDAPKVEGQRTAVRKKTGGGKTWWRSKRFVFVLVKSVSVRQHALMQDSRN